ncbi:phage portal protein [Megamonas hypermegale]|uniref:phage portal protein n=1 Tax=Megamonas hypermegale TaxID=158847 RepID=UPI0026EB464B|nr:phage portal protein [Megamonas hypermegale]
MGIFNFKKRAEPEQATTTAEEKEAFKEPEVDDVLLSALINNEAISRKKAMTIPAVSGAVDYISSTVACMPVKLYKVTKGKVEQIDNDRRTKLLNGDTGDTLDGYQLKKAMVEDYLLGQGGYAYIQKNRNDVTGIFYVADKHVQVMKNDDPIHKKVQFNVYGKTYDQFEFIKLLRNTKDGAKGTGLVREVSKALETAYNTLVYQLSLVKTGGNKKGFLKSTRKLGKEEIDTLKKAWNNLYRNNEENVVVLNNGLEFQEASNSSVEMQLDQNKQTLQKEINDIFHISSNQDETFKNAIYPIIRAFETALNRDLLLENEKKSMFFEFDTKEIVKANLKERYESYKMAKETGFMTLNEIRRAENMNDIEGLDVVNVGLSAVLYDTQTHKYYTPNTDSTAVLDNGEAEAEPQDSNEEQPQALNNEGGQNEN